VKTLEGLKIGFAICGSFCTINTVFPSIEKLISEGADIMPIMSFNAINIDTRFGKAEDFKKRLEELTGNPVLCEISETEPIGPKKLLDALIVAPCTGNTLAKLANGITDTGVLMAIKATLRNSTPVVLSVATNDALGLNLKNLGTLINSKNIYFVPFGQDNFEKKPNSLVAKMDLIYDTLMKALKNEQIQPLIIPY